MRQYWVILFALSTALVASDEDCLKALYELESSKPFVHTEVESVLERISQAAGNSSDSTDFKLALSLIHMKDPTQAQLPSMQKMFHQLIEGTSFEILPVTTEVLAKHLLAKGFVTPETVMFGMSEMGGDLPNGRLRMLRHQAMNEIVKAGRKSNIVSWVAYDEWDVALGGDLYNLPPASAAISRLLSGGCQSGCTDNRNVWANLSVWVADPSAVSHADAMTASIRMLSMAKTAVSELVGHQQIFIASTVPSFFVRAINTYARHPNHDPAVLSQIRELEKKWGPILEGEIKEIKPLGRVR